MYKDFDVQVKGDKVLANIINVDINNVLPNPYFAGFTVSEHNLHSEVERISSTGALLNPILVVETSNNCYIVASGERMYRAARMAGLKTIPIIVLDYTPEEVEQSALLELLQIRELHFFQEARCYSQLINDHKIPIQDIAQNVQKAVSTIEGKIQLLNLPESIWDKLESPAIKEGHARALLRLGNTDFHNAVIERIIEKNYTVKQTEEFIADVLSKGRVDITDPKQPLRFVIKDARIIMNTLKKAIADVQKNIGVEVDMKEEQIGDDLVLTMRVSNKKGK